MAASAMASLPFIKILCAIKASLFLNGDDAVRTHCGTECTADAFFHIGHNGRGVALAVDLVLSDDQQLFRTSGHAQTAALTKVGVKRNFCHLDSSYW
jgi:hypothetical protein